MKSRSDNIMFAALSAVISLAVVLCIVEAVIRATWKNAPRDMVPVQTGLYRESADKNVLFELAPNARGYCSFTHFRHNSLGYRGPEWSARKRGFRVAVAGDSFAYGIGLTEKQTICGRLEEFLKADGVRADCINAGVPGYNLEQNIAHVRKTARYYHPDVIVLSFIYNDLENQINGIEGATPLLNSSLFSSKQERNIFGRISYAMLPIGIGINDTPQVRLRYWIANRWWTYLFVALRLRAMGDYSLPLRRRFTFPQTDSIQMEQMVWKPVEKRMQEFRRLADEYGFKPLLMIFTDVNIEGRPVERVKESARRAGVDAIDMSPYWGDPRNYSRRYSLGWDAHPGAAADATVARALVDFMAVSGWTGIPAKSDERKRRRDYIRLAEKYEVKAKSKKERVAREIDLMRRGFASTIIPCSEGVCETVEDQWLYGWWPIDEFKWDTGGGRWMSGRGAFFLRVPAEGARAMIVEGYRVERLRPAPRMRLMFACSGKPVTGAIPIRPAGFKIKINLPEPPRPGSLLECEIFSTRVVSPALLEFDSKDNRLISAAFTKIDLEP